MYSLWNQSRMRWRWLLSLKLCYTALSLTVLVTDPFTQCTVETSYCVGKCIPSWMLVLPSSHNIISFEPAVDDPGLSPFQLRVVNFDLVQGRQAYPKIETQDLSISNVMNRSNYNVQIILICGSRFIQYTCKVYPFVHVPYFADRNAIVMISSLWLAINSLLA